MLKLFSPVMLWYCQGFVRQRHASAFFVIGLARKVSTVASGVTTVAGFDMTTKNDWQQRYR